MIHSYKMLLVPLLLFTTLSPLFGEEKEPNTRRKGTFCPQYYRHKDAPTIFVKAGYLYQNIYTENVNIAWQRTALLAKRSIARPILSGANGYTLEVRGSAEKDGWLASAAYFYLLYSPGMENNKLSEPHSYSPNFADSLPAYSQLNSRYEIIFNRVDLNLFRPSYIGYFMHISPKIGLSGAWDLSILDYFAQTTLSEVQKGNFKQEWFGIGPSAALEICLCLIDPLFLCINFDASIFLANHHNRNKNFSYENAALNDPNAINNSSYTFNQVEPNFRSSLGIKIEKMYPYWSVSFAVGWQLSHYFSHTFIPKYFSPTGISGDLSMQGLTTTLEFGF
ncbi:hypothetical protein K0U07_02235 [bacterium]|nr:hypothetical protein [bacterium]